MGLFHSYEHRFQRFYRLSELTNTNKAGVDCQNSNIDPTEVVPFDMIFLNEQENWNISHKQEKAKI